MKKIVVFIYPFEKIERIVDYAFRFAQDLNAEVEFVHAVEAAPINYELDLDKQVPDNIATATTIGAIQEDLVQERQRILQKAISIKKASMVLSVPFTFSVISGSHLYLSDEISKRQDVDLIMVPIGQDDTYDVTASDLAEASKHPILAFPVNLNYQRFKTIVYASDYHDEDISILKELTSLAAPLGASVTVLHVSKRKNDFEEELKKAGLEELINRKISFMNIPVLQEESGKASMGIKEFCKMHYADLIVLMREDKNFFQRIFGRSTTKELLKDTAIPVLVYHQ